MYLWNSDSYDGVASFFWISRKISWKFTVRLCIAMYAFISGYGMTAKSEEKNLKLLDDIKQAINQIINFLIRYWLVFIIFIPIGLKMGILKFKLGEFIGNLIGNLVVIMRSGGMCHII